MWKGGGKIEKKLIREQGCANAPLGFAIMVLLNILNCNNSGCRGCPKYPNYYCKVLREQMVFTSKRPPSVIVSIIFALIVSIIVAIF